MIEQQRLCKGLQQVDEVVMASNVCELMREDRLDLGGVELRHRRDRQYHNRPKTSNHERHLDAG
jgi:hypothetical protein